jgi:hypothetical protein
MGISDDYRRCVLVGKTTVTSQMTAVVAISTTKTLLPTLRLHIQQQKRAAKR